MIHKGEPTDLIVHKVRELDLTAGSGLFVSATGRGYVVADDLKQLYLFGLEDEVKTSWAPIFKGPISEDYLTRKKEKADLESLTFLEPNEKWKHGALLLVPSGSTEIRRTAALVQLTSSGEAMEEVLGIDFEDLYEKIAKKLGASLNIEGVITFRNTLRLFQRGNGLDGVNATIDLPLCKVVEAIQGGEKIKPKWIGKITRYDLGSLDGVPLSFSDAVTLADDLILFSASAEDSKDTVEDGMVKGSVLGLMDRAGAILNTYRLLGTAVKVEGIWGKLSSDGKNIHVHMVTDADDPGAKSQLLEATITLKK